MLAQVYKVLEWKFEGLIVKSLKDNSTTPWAWEPYSARSSLWRSSLASCTNVLLRAHCIAIVRRSHRSSGSCGAPNCMTPVVVLHRLWDPLSPGQPLNPLSHSTVHCPTWAFNFHAVMMTTRVCTTYYSGVASHNSFSFGPPHEIFHENIEMKLKFYLSNLGAYDRMATCADIVFHSTCHSPGPMPLTYPRPYHDIYESYYGMGLYCFHFVTITFVRNCNVIFV